MDSVGWACLAYAMFNLGLVVVLVVSRSPWFALAWAVTSFVWAAAIEDAEGKT